MPEAPVLFAMFINSIFSNSLYDILSFEPM